MEKNTLRFWESKQVSLDEEYRKTERYPYYHLRLKTVSDILRQYGGHRILDIGSGGGHITLLCAMMGFEVYACDYAQEMVDATTYKLAQFGYTTVPVKRADIRNLEIYPAKFFDVILAMSPFEYIPREHQTLAYREMKRILTDDGYIVNQVINGLFDFSTFNRFTVNYWREKIWPNFFTPEEIDEMTPTLKELIKFPDKPDTTGKFSTTRDQVQIVSENPLTYAKDVEAHGLKEIDRIYSHLHLVPPLMCELKYGFDMYHKAYRFEEEYGRHYLGMFLAADFISMLKKL